MNPIGSLLLTLAIWALALLGNASAAWLIAGLAACLGLRIRLLRQQQLYISRDPMLLAVLLPAIALALYAAMFSIIEVKTYLDSDDQEQYSVLWIGCNFLYAMLVGGAWQLVVYGKRTEVTISPPTPRPQGISTLLLFAWGPLLIAAACYFSFFAGKEYVEIHSNPSIAANILLKTIYFSYAATFLIARAQFISDSIRKKHILFILVGHIVVFAILYKLRSPAVFFLLFSLFLVGHSIPKQIIWVAGLAMPWALALIALARDPSLLEKGPGLAIVTLVITFGDFVDAMRFSADYIASSGPLWGMGMLGSLAGFSEPLANLYAKSISEDYFDSGGGFGFFILADIYANFGTIFGVAFSIAFGYFLSRLTTSKFGTTGSYLSGILFSSAIALTRNDFGSTLRGFIYCLLAYGLLQIIVRQKEP